MRSRVPSWACVAASLTACFLVAMPATAQEHTAPLPPHWTTSHSEEDEDDYRPPAPIAGIYGHGFSGQPPLRRIGMVSCKGDQAERDKLNESIGYETEFWFYATGAQGVMFRRTATIDETQPCATALRYELEMDRAFVADCMVHTLNHDRNGKIDFADTNPITSSEGGMAGAFNPIHNLMARTPLPRGRGSYSDRVAGTPVRCSPLRGLAWSQVCIVSSGALRGMLLRAVSGDDEGEFDHMEFDTLDPSAMLDGRLFEMRRHWYGE